MCMYTCTCMSCIYSMSWVHRYMYIFIPSPSRHHLTRCQLSELVPLNSPLAPPAQPCSLATCSSRNGRDRGFVLYIFLFLRVLGWWVCVCLYTRVHTHKLLGYLMWAQVWDEHLESQKNPDRLKHIIHVDRIGVHSTFVYKYAVLRVLMIWANAFFF